MLDRFSEKLLIVAGKIANQRHVSAIKNAFTALLPVIIAGAFCTLFANVVCSTTTLGISLAKVPGFAWLEHFTPMFTAANYATLNFMTIGLIVLLALEFGRQFGRNEFIVPVVAISSFITLCNTTATAAVEGMDPVTITNVLPRNFTNAEGLFLGMITTLISVEIFCRIVNSGKMQITMPDSVPQNVASTFGLMLPAVFTILLISGFGLLFQTVTSYSVSDAINMVIQEPLKGVLTGLPGYLLVFGLSTVFWFIGIHGTNILKPVYQATMLQAVLANTEAVSNGQAPEFILNESFAQVFTNLGGTGCTLGFLIGIFLFSTRDDHRSIAKLSVAPNIFNINETMTFGMPIILNPVLLIPFILTPLLTATFAYFMTVIGFCGVMVYSVPWTTPPLLIAWLASGGSIGAVITQLICILISFVVYLPFIFISNRQQLAA